MGKGMNIMNMMSGKKKVVEEKKVVAEEDTKDKKSRITFARKVPGAMDFDDVEESITGQKHRRKKTFVTAGDGTGAGAGAGAGQDQQNVKERGNRANGRSTGAGTRPQRGKDEGNPNAFITQPGALSPLQGLDLGKEREHKSFQLHKHYGWLYGESKETPTKWFYRNIGKANAAVVSFVQTCGIMLKANSSDSREKATTTK